MAIEELFYPEVMRSTVCENTPYPILNPIVFRVKGDVDIFAHIPYPFDIVADDCMKCSYGDDTFIATVYDVHIYDGFPFVFRLILVDTKKDENKFYIERLSSRAMESFEILEKIRSSIGEDIIEPKRRLGLHNPAIIQSEMKGTSSTDKIHPTVQDKFESLIERIRIERIFQGIKSEYVDVVDNALYDLYKITEKTEMSLSEETIDLLITKLPQFPLIVMGIFRQLKEDEFLHEKLKGVKFVNYMSNFGYQIRLSRKLKSIYNS